MALRIAPLSWSLIPDASIQTSDAAFFKGFPASNLSDDDIFRVAVGRGLWEMTATDRDLDIDQGFGSVRAQIAIGTYHGPGPTASVAIEALNSVGSLWYAYQIQDAVNRNHWVLGRTSGTGALLCNSGANVATSAWAHLGFSTDYDRAAAVSHVSDFPAIQGTGGDQVLYDLSTAKTAQMSAVVNPVGGKGFAPVVRFGTTTAVSDATETDFGEHDDEMMVSFFSSPQRYRYVRLDLVNPRGSTPGVGAGYFYLGPYFETGRSWEWGSYSRSKMLEIRPSVGILGVPFLTELEPGETFSVSFSSSPGLDDADALSVLSLLEDLGVSDYAIVSVDQTSGYINRETKMCRVVSVPSAAHVYDESKSGRWSVELEFEVAK
jgi:hypothetical protein